MFTETGECILEYNVLSFCIQTVIYDLYMCGVGIGDVGAAVAVTVVMVDA